MAVSKKNNNNNEKVEYTAPMDYSRDKQQDILVAVNGKVMRIKRGETVMIPRKYLKVLQNADRQTREAFLNQQKAQTQK